MIKLADYLHFGTIYIGIVVYIKVLQMVNYRNVSCCYVCCMTAFGSVIICLTIEFNYRKRKLQACTSCMASRQWIIASLVYNSTPYCPMSL